MMEYPSCKDAVFGVVNEATVKFSDLYYLNKEKYEGLDEICNIADEVVQMLDEEFGGASMAVQVDTTTKDLIFNMVCDELTVQDQKTGKFLELVGVTDGLRFSKASDDRLRIEVLVSGLWSIGEAE